MLKDVLPAELLQQGKSIEEVADELIHTESKPSEEEKKELDSEENPEVGVGEAPESAAPAEEPPPAE